MGAELVAIKFLFGKALERIEGSFTDKVINRWSGFRARRFLNTFAEAVAREAQDQGGEKKVNALLDELLSNETKTEVLFEAYRRVLLSASKDLGPRIIALLTAHLIQQNRYATDDEEIVFRAAEGFTDRELQSFRAHLTHVINQYGGDVRFFRTSLDKKRIRMSRRSSETVPIGAMNLIEVLGSWAPKAVQIGLLREEIVEETTYRGARLDDDVEYEREIEWYVVYAPGSGRLVELIERAEASMSGSKDEP